MPACRLGTGPGARAIASPPRVAAYDARHMARGWIVGGAMLAVVIAGLPAFGAIAAPAHDMDAPTREAISDLGTRPHALGAGSASARRDARQMVTPLGPGQPLPPPADGAERPGGAARLTVRPAPGDTVAAALVRAGSDPRDAAAIDRALASVATGRDPGAPINLMLASHAGMAGPGDTRPVAEAVVRPRFDMLVTASRAAPGQSLVISVRRLAVTTRLMPFSGVVGDDGLYRAARAAGVPTALAVDALKVLARQVTVEGGVRSGDRLALVAAQRRVGDVSDAPQSGAAAATPVLVYAGLVRDGKPIARLQPWGRQGGARWIDAADAADALAPATRFAGIADGGGGPAIRPTDGRVTSPYGARRHPILGYWKMHRGIDFGGGMGAPVRAAGPGVVARAGWNGGYGRYVRLDHGATLGSGYAHLSRVLVRAGDRVAAGQLIGLVGSTGFSTGPHLHFEVYERGMPVDPGRLGMRAASSPPPSAQSLPPPDHRAFMARMARMERIAGLYPPPSDAAIRR